MAKRSIRMRVTDVRHMDEDPASMTKEAARIADFLGRIVATASRHLTQEELVSLVRCRRRPGREACPGYIAFRRENAENRIVWACPKCGDQGLITNWTGTRWDHSWSPGVYGSLPPIAWFLVSPHEFALLKKLEWDDEDLTAVLAGATWADDSGDIGMPASKDELQGIQGIFGAEMDSAYHRHRADRFDELWDRVDSLLDTV